MKDIRGIASLSELPLLSRMLPPSLWPEAGDTLTAVEKYAALVSELFYVRILDKMLPRPQMATATQRQHHSCCWATAFLGTVMGTLVQQDRPLDY